jgi:predicted transcriptional regulator
MWDQVHAPFLALPSKVAVIVKSWQEATILHPLKAELRAGGIVRLTTRTLTGTVA